MLTDIFCVIPSTIGVGDYFKIKIKLKTAPYPVPCANQWATPKPGLNSPYNLAVQRKIQYLDNVPKNWKGKLILDGGSAFNGPKEVIFDGENQGVYENDNRPIKEIDGFSWTTTGFHFLKIIEPESGITAFANAVYVTSDTPEEKIVWGDPHWQSFFTDGIRCPEELYTFARDEAFLDFGAISDHSEGLTDQQWNYFQSVTNDFNEANRFVTLIGQEWTNHICGHRNIYYRGNKGPIFRATNPLQNTLEKLWTYFDDLSSRGFDIIAIPHHTSNKVMGCDWSFAWNPSYEKSVEIHSIWGSSEYPGTNGNLYPIRVSEGEVPGQHIIDALNKGFKFGFIGGGDIHDGRPGDDLSRYQPDVPQYHKLYKQGLTALRVSRLTREDVFDAIKNHNSYATTNCRIFLDTSIQKYDNKLELSLKCASEYGLKEISIINNGNIVKQFKPSEDPRFFHQQLTPPELKSEDYFYIRAITNSGDTAWSSPYYN